MSPQNTDANTWQTGSASHFKGFEFIEHIERWKFIRYKEKKKKSANQNLDLDRRSWIESASN